mmetsp:Transcript_43053/g.51663  ORF Transcript_43053/g.51663 Transcript_43053/m.51663 type:complete len:118 (+) Transcript_43053:1068-1421(+)
MRFERALTTAKDFIKIGLGLEDGDDALRVQGYELCLRQQHQKPHGFHMDEEMGVEMWECEYLKEWNLLYLPRCTTSRFNQGNHMATVTWRAGRLAVWFSWKWQMLHRLRNRAPMRMR